MITLLTDTQTNPNGELTPENVVKAFDILKAQYVTSKNMTVSDFKLFASERLEGILRDAKIVLGSNLDANEAFRKGFVAYANGVDVRKRRLLKLLLMILIPNLLRRGGRFGKPEMGFNMLFLIRTLFPYDISPAEVLMGGKRLSSLLNTMIFSTFIPVVCIK